MIKPRRLPPVIHLRLGWRWAALFSLVFITGCQMVYEAGQIPAKTVSTIAPRRKEQSVAPDVLQVELQRCADDYLGHTVSALDDYARRAGTAKARQQALQWKLAQASSVIGIVSGPNPSANLADLMALATTSRLALEENWSKTSEREAFQPWLDTSRELETKVWKLADGILTAAQQKEFRDSIQRGWSTNAGQTFAFFSRPQEVSALIRQSGQKGTSPENVLALFGLDPTAGLDPAVREVTRTRLFAERALYSTQRLPLILRWQIELLAENLLDGPLVAAVEEQEGKLRQLAQDATQTLVAGERMSASLNTTLTTFDALMQRFGVGVTNLPPRSGANDEPFLIRDYEQAAARIETSARQLNELLMTLDRTAGSTNLVKLSEQVAPVVQQAKTCGTDVVDHAFRKGVLLVVVILVAALAYRLLVACLQAIPLFKNRP